MAKGMNDCVHCASGAGDEWVVYLCPLHKSALALLEALEVLQKETKLLGEESYAGLLHSDVWYRVTRAARACSRAIAQAKGV